MEKELAEYSKVSGITDHNVLYTNIFKQNFKDRMAPEDGDKPVKLSIVVRGKKKRLYQEDEGLVGTHTYANKLENQNVQTSQNGIKKDTSSLFKYRVMSKTLFQYCETIKANSYYFKHFLFPLLI